MRPLVAIFLLVFATSTSHSTSCFPRQPTTLAIDYQSAADIYVGEVVGCTDGTVPGYRRCPEERYLVQVLNVLKDGYPELGGFSELQGSNWMGCRLNLAVGTRFLVFTDAQGRLQQSSQSLAGGHAKTKVTRERRRILAAYRDGVVDDLSEPWFFSDFMFACSLNHQVEKSSLGFGYFYGDPKRSGQAQILPKWDEDGNFVPDLVRIAGPTADEIESEHSGPTLEPSQVVFSVSLNMAASTIENTGVARVGNRQWPLLTSRETTRFRGGEPNVHVREVIGGADALEILDAMRDTVDIVVSVRSSGYFGPRPPVPEDLATTLETRTTHIGDKIDEFLACVDGTNRNPPRILDSYPQ